MCIVSRSMMWSLLLLSLYLIACDHKEKPIVLPHSKGLPSEVLLVTDDAVGQSDVMDSLNALTQQCLPEIMQPETMFRVLRVSQRNYTQRYITMHTKLFVNIDKSLSAPMMGISRDVEATPQTEVTVSAPSLNELRLFLSHHQQQVTDALLDGQLLVRMTDLRKHHNAHVANEVRRHMGYSICVPKNVCAVKKGKRFLVSKRDSVMKCNIPGEKAGQWMQTSRVDGNALVMCRRRNLQGREFVEMRGMWDVRKAPIGGPFVSTFTVDTARQTVLAAEGFVYSPSTEKRDLLRLLEASLLTIRKQR